MDPLGDTRHAIWRAQALEPGLYPVATPIGNLRDITLRALDILANCDLVLAEDTRTTRVLFDAYGLKTSLQAYHEHNAAALRPAILSRIGEGQAIGLVSDAGTPLISDPGFKLVRDVIDAGGPVVAAPGASAVLTALVIAGLPTDRFFFGGFAPAKSGQRREAFTQLATLRATLVFFEAKSRLAATLADMAHVFGERDAVVARELTKRFEHVRRAPLPDLAKAVSEEGAPKGELVILVGPPRHDAFWDVNAVDEALRRLIPERGVKAASADVADAAGWAKRDVYARALTMKSDDGGQ